MTNRKRKGKRHRPFLPVNTLVFLSPAAKADRAELMLRFNSALDALARQENPGDVEWRLVADAINTVETLVNPMGRLLHDEVMPSVDRAVKGMAEAARRFREGKALRLSADGLEAVRDVIAVYEQCLDGLTGAEMDEARQRTQDRVNELVRQRSHGPEVVAL